MYCKEINKGFKSKLACWSDGKSTRRLNPLKRLPKVWMKCHKKLTCKKSYEAIALYTMSVKFEIAKCKRYNFNTL